MPLNYLKKIVSTQLFRVSSLNTVSVAVRIAGGLVAAKIIALFIGPSGLALIGNFRNFLSSLDSVATLGFQNGIIKYVAESEKDEARLKKILATVFTLLFGVILVLSIVLYILSGYAANWILSNTNYAWIFKLLALALPWYAGNIVLISVLNGLGKYRQVIYLNIWGNAIGVGISAVLIAYFKVAGAFIGLIASPSLLFVFSFFMLQKQFPRFAFWKKENIDFTLLKGFFSYSLMSLVTAVLGPVVYVSVRNMLIKSGSAEEAGFWEAMNRLSVFYLMFVSTMLTVYFLPQLSRAETDTETKKIFRSYYVGIVPIFIAGITIIYFLREFIILLLFSSAFLPMKELFLWQLFGDLLKVCTLILGYQFFASKNTKGFIIAETFSFISLYLLSIKLVALHGAEGAVMAHAINYGIQLVLMMIYFRKKLF